jgi:hypothetical protein
MELKVKGKFVTTYFKNENFLKSFLSHIGKNKCKL